MKNIIPFFLIVLSALGGEVSAYRTLSGMTTRPFTASEIRTLFTAYGKEKMQVEAPGNMPDGWGMPAKPKQHAAIKLQWDATFNVEHPAKYSFALTEPHVCAALYLDGGPVAAWMEHFPAVQLAAGKHSLQLFVILRQGEHVPQIVSSMEGYAVKLAWEALPQAKVEASGYLVQTGKSLVLEKGQVKAQPDGVSRIVPGRRIDTRAHISNMATVHEIGKPLPVKLQLDYPDAWQKLLQKTEICVNYETSAGKSLGQECFQIEGHEKLVNLQLKQRADMARFTFSIAGVCAFPDVHLHLIRPESQMALRPSGNNVFVGDERAVLLVDSKTAFEEGTGAGRVLILDALGDETMLLATQRRFPEAEVKQVLVPPGTAEDLGLLGAFPIEAKRVVLLGRMRAETLLFLCRYCVARGIQPIAVSLPGERRPALEVKELGYRLNIQVLDLRL